jgi:L-ascorbate metabolism protein UlaG (beta-lactamase superfamily)
MQFTYYGHSCFSVEIGGKKLLFDPFISGNPLAKNVDINKIEADYILVSHGHGDHIADLVSIAKRTEAMLISNFEIVTWAQKQGCEKGHGMNFGAYDFEFGEVRFVPAAHSSGLPDGSYGGNPGGIIIRSEENSFYFAGDTCLTMDMKLIPYYANLDFALLPIGGNFTMNVSDAIIAAEFIECKKIIGVHFDSFPPIKIDHEKSRRRFEAAGLELILPEIGKTITV